MKILSFKNYTGLLTAFSTWRRAVALVWRAAPLYTGVWIAITIVLGILPGVSVYLTKFAIDGIVAAKNSGGARNDVYTAILFVSALAGVMLAAEVLRYLDSWNRTAQAELVYDGITSLIHKQAATVDIAYYESSEYHDLLEQAIGESSSKPLALLTSLGSIIQSAITVAAMAAILISYSWWLPILLFAGTLPALYVAVRTDRRYHRWWKSTSDARRWGSYYDTMQVHNEAALEMRLFGLSKHYSDLYQGIREKLRFEKLAHLKRQSIGKLFASLFALLAAAGAVIWMGMRVLYGVGTLGDLGVFYQIFSRGQSLMGTLLGSVGNTLNHSLYLESLFRYLDLEPKITSPENPVVLNGIRQGIEFENVTFYYPNTDKPALENLSLKFPAGSIVSLVGVNGSGKTTIIKLINRFYDPTEGTIRIDGVDIRDLELTSLRKSISVLFQFPLHYHATAENNIRLGDIDRDSDEEEVVRASRKAGADKFISELPNGYKTLLGKWFVDGTELSGGEWQRLALARAYFRRAPLVILDEPTSFMDSWSEADWFERFKEMIAGQTGVLITHRFTIAMRADMIHVVDNGRIIESGTHNELLRRNGLYASSWNSQMQTASDIESAPDHGNDSNADQTLPKV